MARKPTAIGEIKALLKEHAGYKAIKWQCTGRHRHHISTLHVSTPMSCPEGHPYHKIKEIPIKTYLRNDTEGIKKKYERTATEYELGA